MFAVGSNNKKKIIIDTLSCRVGNIQLDKFWEVGQQILEHVKWNAARLKLQLFQWLIQNKV